MTVVVLTSEVPSFAWQALSEIALVVEGPSCAVVTGDGPIPIDVVSIGLAEIDSFLDRSSPRQHLLLIRGLLDDETAARLQDNAVSYIDASGKAWLPGVKRTVLGRDDSRRSTARAIPPERMRAAQLLVDYPEQVWTERELAGVAEVSPGTAHNLLTQLEREGLIVREGIKRGTTRQVPDFPKLRRWLAEHGRPQRTRRLPCFLPEIKTGNIDGLGVALTGAAGAAALGMPVVTQIPNTFLRVGVTSPELLDDVPAALGGMRATKGANAVLIADSHKLGLLDARKLKDGTLVAPPSRVMLDLYLEPRGSAAVDVMLDLWRDSARGRNT